MNNAIFIHAAILDNCKERVLQYLNIINNSGLVDKVKYINICFVGDKEIPINEHDIVIYNKNNNIHLIKLSNNLQDYEIPTLNYLYNFCLKNDNYNILYIHTKNVGKEVNYCIEDQIEYMLYFLITKWKTCIEELNKCHVCSVDLRIQPTLHYSGNFWWSKSEHIISLPSPIDFNNLSKYPNPLNSLRHNQEFWICYNIKNKFVSLWDCGINVYERHLHLYPKKNYIKS
jgi:hypothetical protein